MAHLCHNLDTSKMPLKDAKTLAWAFMLMPEICRC